MKALSISMIKSNSQQQRKGPTDAEIFGYAMEISSTTKRHSITNAEQQMIPNLNHHQAAAIDQGHNAINKSTTNIKSALNIADAWEECKCKSILLKSEN